MYFNDQDVHISGVKIIHCEIYVTFKMVFGDAMFKMVFGDAMFKMVFGNLTFKMVFGDVW